MKANDMPISAIQGATGSAIIAVTMATTIVMLLTPPRSKREWAVGLISTLMGSICGGAALVKYLGIESWVESTIGLIALGGLIFSCGLPAWAIVRWIFNYIGETRNESLKDVLIDGKNILAGVKEAIKKD
jgi:hypothetical protein